MEGFRVGSQTLTLALVQEIKYTSIHFNNTSKSFRILQTSINFQTGLSLVCNNSLHLLWFFIDCRIAVQAENEFFDSWEGAPTATQAMVAVEEALRTYGIDKVPITTNDVWPSGNFASGEGQVDVYV